MRKQKGNAKRIMSGFMAVLTVLSTMMQPITTFAAETSSDGKIPLYKDVADLLDADEVVVAHDHGETDIYNLELEVIRNDRKRKNDKWKVV